jgi:4-alpha-glucanotransferase
LEPITIAWDGGPADVLIRLLDKRANGNFAWRIDYENEETKSGTLCLEDLRDGESAEIGGTRYLEKLFTLPDGMPLGYHSLTLEIQGAEFRSLVIASPTRAFSPRGRGWERSWGMFAPLHALHSQNSWSAGDFGDLHSLSEWAHWFGAEFVGTLPLLAAFLDEPFEISPYSPASRLFWNEFYLNISQIPELSTTPAARQLLETAHMRDEIESLRSASVVDYRRQMALKRPVLEELAKSFFSVESDRRGSFGTYVSQNSRLEDYAIFRAVGEQLRKPWPEWPSRLRECSIEPGDFSDASKLYHMYVQWLADEQLQRTADRGDGAGLYMDLPLGVNSNGYDVWRERQSFAVGVTGGCPPDVVFPNGQNWGFVPLHPEGIRNDGYRYVRDYLRHQLKKAKVLRIDHMPSFHRVFWIPPGGCAKDGVYVRYQAEELYAIFCLESTRHSAMLVGEDLGTVPPEVPKSMARHNFHRMYVVQYELKPDAMSALPESPASSIASVNTHDMAPFAGFWQGRDIEERCDSGILSQEGVKDEYLARDKVRKALRQFLDVEEITDEVLDAANVYRACLAQLRDGPSRLLMINLEDLWQETQSQNIPSTSDESLNWRRKARFSIEEFCREKQVRDLLREVNRGFGFAGEDGISKEAESGE